MRTGTLTVALERLGALLALPAEERDASELADLLREVHPSDVAARLEHLELPRALEVFGLLDDNRAAETLHEVSPETGRYLLEHSPRERAVNLLDILPMDDAAEVVSEYGPPRAEPILAGLPSSDAAEVRELLSYPEQTAGRLMTDNVALVSPQTTVAGVMEVLHRKADTLETVHEVYVVDPGERLAGVCQIRRLLMAEPGRPIGEIMVHDPLTVPPETDQQEVARIIARYNFLALPVTDDAGRFLGIVTVDDVIDVLVEEFNEDYMRLVGSDAEEMERRTPAQVARLRLPWLIGTMVIELFAGLVIARFGGVLKEVILLASFMPVISAVSGNVGLQAAAIVVRGLDTGHVSLGGWVRSVGKEIQTSLLLALVCGALLGAVGAAWSRHLPFGVVIGAAMTCSMMTAGAMGTLIPMLSKRLGFDPATTAGPFETAFQDVVGFTVFLWLASLLLHWLA